MVNTVVRPSINVGLKKISPVTQSASQITSWVEKLCPKLIVLDYLVYCGDYCDLEKVL